MYKNVNKLFLERVWNMISTNIGMERLLNKQVEDA